MGHTFARANGLGKWGEKQVINHLLKSPAIDTVQDVSDIKEYQDIGIDIIYELADGAGSTVSADVKLDRLIARTGNLFIETMSSHSRMGNLITSKADFFLYLDPFECKLYWVDRKKMFDWWQKNQKDIPIKVVDNKDRKTQGICITKELILELGLATVEDIYVEGSKLNPSR